MTTSTTLTLKKEQVHLRQTLRQGYELMIDRDHDTGQPVVRRREVSGNISYRRPTGETVTRWADLTPYERRLVRKERAKTRAQRELAVFGKIMAAEADLAEVREALKTATDAANVRAMRWAVAEVERLEARLVRLRGGQPERPRRPRRSGRTETRRLGDKGLFVAVEGCSVGYRSAEVIAEDKLEDLRQDKLRDLMERGEAIAALQGHRPGSRDFIVAASEAAHAIHAIERLQAFEDTVAAHGDAVAVAERMAHYGGVEGREG